MGPGSYNISYIPRAESKIKNHPVNQNNFSLNEKRQSLDASTDNPTQILELFGKVLKVAIINLLQGAMMNSCIMNEKNRKISAKNGMY